MNERTDAKHAEKVSRAHTRYYTKTGQLVPGVTTVLGVLNKPALVKWANDLGLKGIQVGKYVDELATIGTLAHYIIECHLKKEKPDYSNNTPNQVSLAENSAIKFMEWQDAQKDFKLLATERQFISEQFLYGGTIDLYCEIDGKKCCVDIKTCKGVYDEMHTQVVAYAKALTEEGNRVDEIKIVRVGRNEDEGFEVVNVGNFDLHWNRFLACKKIYELNKQIKDGGKK